MKNTIQIPKDVFEKIFLQQGGEVDNKMDINKALTGDFMTGMDKNNPIQEANAEVESGEMIQQPGGTVQEVLGKKHSQGGEDVVLEDGARVLSDHLKIGGPNARKFSKLFNVELKASDTYATVLDKINRKTGLTKLVKEEEEIIKKLDKIKKDSKDEVSLGLNTQYLSGKINELEKDKRPLEQIKETAFNGLFDAQEESKPAEKKENHPSEGMETQEEFEVGGMYNNDAVTNLAKKYNIPQERLGSILKEYAQDGIQKTPQLSKDETKARFDFWLSTLRAKGYEGSDNVSEARKWQAKNDPTTVIKYYTADGQPLNAKHVDMIKSQYKDIFTKTGINPSKPSATYTNEEKARLQEAMGTNLTPEFIIEGHDDNKTDWRAPLSPMQPMKAVDWKRPEIKAPLMPVGSGTPGNPAPVEGTQEPSGMTPEAKVRGEGANLLFLPNQNPMLPNSLGQSLKLTDRAYQIQKSHISPEQAIAEGNRNQTTLTQELNNMPGAQRAAVLAQMAGNQQEAINKAVFDANRYNASADTTAENQQAALDTQSNRMNAQHALSYEQRTQRAQAMTDNDLNNYYNTIRQNNVRNFNEVNDINLRNAKYDNFQFDGNNFVQIATPNFSTESSQNKTPEQRAVEEKAIAAAKAKAIKSAKKGGRFKK